MSVQSLIDAARLAPPPHPVDWPHAERHLKMALPADYRELVDAGGAGVWFNDLRLYSPRDPLRSHDLLDSNGVFEDLLFFWEEDPEFRPTDLPDDARLIAWASTGHGERLFWRVDADNPSAAYPIYIENGDGTEWERFDMSTTDFLLGVLRGDVTCRFFSGLFMHTEQVFRPYVH